MLHFETYLTSVGLSPKSLKNYRSDVSHFTGWLILKVRSFGAYIENLEDAVPFISSDIAREYKNYLSQNKVPAKTINRRLSTLRHLSKHMFASNHLDFDFMKDIENISASGKPKRVAGDAIVGEFRTYLEAEKVSPNTIKNYLSDVRQFLAWVESH